VKVLAGQKLPPAEKQGRTERHGVEDQFRLGRGPARQPGRVLDRETSSRRRAAQATAVEHNSLHRPIRMLTGAITANQSPVGCDSRSHA